MSFRLGAIYLNLITSVKDLLALSLNVVVSGFSVDKLLCRPSIVITQQLSNVGKNAPSFFLIM